MDIWLELRKRSKLQKYAMNWRLEGQEIAGRMGLYGFVRGYTFMAYD